jgi:ABC-2 type transport system permease protein
MKQKEYNRGIKYYFRVWKTILKNSFKSYNVYKLDVVIRIIRMVFVVVVQLALLQVVFGEQEAFVGWSKSQAYLVAGIWNLLNYSGWAFFGVNLLRLDQTVLNGNFDFIILKPLSSAFLASFSDFFISNFITAISGVILVGYYFVVEWSTLEIVNVLIWILTMICAFVVWYSIHLAGASYTLKNPRNGYLDLIKEVLGTTKYPTDIFGDSVQFVFYTFFPLAFLTSIPANILIGKISIYWVFGSIVLAIISLFLANLLWKMNIKYYSSSGG